MSKYCLLCPTSGEAWDVYADFCEDIDEPSDKILELRLKSVRAFQIVGWSDSQSQCAKVTQAVQCVKEFAKRANMILGSDVENFLHICELSAIHKNI